MNSVLRWAYAECRWLLDFDTLSLCCGSVVPGVGVMEVCHDGDLTHCLCVMEVF